MKPYSKLPHRLAPLTPAKVFGLVAAATTLLIVPAAQATSWWDYIQCHSSVGNPHTSGSAPKKEPLPGNAEQCHGKQGDSGSCDVYSPSNEVWGDVFCQNRLYSGSQCVAMAECNIGGPGQDVYQTISCVGINGNAYVNISGNTAIVHCDGENGESADTCIATHH